MDNKKILSKICWKIKNMEQRCKVVKNWLTEYTVGDSQFSTERR